jgi:hypothetical protein
MQDTIIVWKVSFGRLPALKRDGWCRVGCPNSQYKDTCKIAFLLASPFSEMSREVVRDGSNCNSYSYSLAKQQFPFIVGEDRQVQNIV